MRFKRRTGFHNYTSIARDWSLRRFLLRAPAAVDHYVLRRNTRMRHRKNGAKTTMILRTLLLLTPYTLFAQSGSSVIEELVTANRILVNEGVLDAYGHVSIRDPAHPDHYFLARSMPPSLVT